MKNVKTRKKKVSTITIFPQRIVKAIFLILPALISFSWLTYLKLTNKSIIISQAGIMLGPPIDSKKLALVLLIFTIGYLMFLLVLFYSNIKQAFEELMTRLH